MKETHETQQMVQSAQAGDSAAIAWLYEEHAPRLYRYFLLRLRGQTQQAEDLTAEVFVRVLKRLESYEYRGLPFGAWLFRVARNVLIDYQRSLPRGPFVDLEICHNLSAPASDRALDQAVDRQILTQALSRLTREQREVIQLRFVQGLSIAEAAAAVGKTEDAVKKLQARGLQAMRRLLVNEGSVMATRERAEPAALRLGGLIPAVA
jgi:RNA polymerase sigma-70 factor (ECF subfamily)